jgi:hypothetical protein
VGYAPLGEDAGHLTSSSLLLDVSPAGDSDLDAAVFEGYVDGLRDAGWRLDHRLRDQVRFGYAAHAALNMGLFVGAGVPAAFTRDWIRRWYERQLGRPLEDLCESLALLSVVCLDLADEARALGRSHGWLD